MEIKNVIEGLIAFITSLTAVYFGNLLIVDLIMPLISESMEKTFFQYFLIIIYIILILIIPTIIALRED